MSNSISLPYCTLCEVIPWNVFKAVFGCVTFLSNVLTLRALTRCCQLKMSLKYCFINLAITDTLSGFVFTYHSVVLPFLDNSVIECKIRYGLVSMTAAVTLFTLNMLSMDRLFALQFPLKYDTYVGKKMLVGFTVLSWFIAAVFVIPSVATFRDMSVCNFVTLMRKESFLSFSVGCFFLTTTIIGCHIRIFILARSQIAKILPTMLQENQATALMKMNVKATVTTAIVLVPFCLLNIPMFTYFACLAANSELAMRENALDIMDIILLLQLTNSFLNPIIYAWRLPELRRHFRVKFPCCGRQSLAKSCSSESETRSTNLAE